MKNITTVEQLYRQYIQSISEVEQLQLIALISENLAHHSQMAFPSQASLLELEGLGAEIWKGCEAQEYVDKLRQEWNTVLDQALAGITKLGIDTSPFIYFIESHPIYLRLMRDIIQRIDTGTIRATEKVLE